MKEPGKPGAHGAIDNGFLAMDHAAPMLLGPEGS